MINMAGSEFGPRIILDELQAKERAFFEAWGIEERARVLPFVGNPKKEFAVWHGEFSARGETPVMAVAIGSRQVFPNTLINWVYGVAYRSDVESDPDRLGALLDAARFPADTLSGTLGMLACMAPAEQAIPA